MPAIPVHHTAVDSKSTWDAAKVVADTKADLRYVNTWVDPNADPTLKGSYKLPHHLRNGGPAILAGVNAAKSRAPQMKGVPQADMAGITAHLNAHQADAKQSVLQTIQFWLEQIFHGGDETETNEQAISMPNIYSLVNAALHQTDPQDSYMGLVDVYLDGGAVFAVVSKDGLLYRADVALLNGGVTLGPLTQVVIDYKPATQSLKTTRQANGKYRWFAFPAATAVLNRSGELDSRELFENFVKRIEEGAPYPFLSFYHVGEAITLGQADYVAVDGYTLLISGLWNDTPLAQATRQAIEANPDYYGNSIGYMYAPETKQQMQVGDGITIPVYTDGILVECSILAERDAACLMTGAYTEGANRMNQEAKTELERIAAGDPALLAQIDELAKHVDSVNADTAGMIRREGAEAATTEPAAPVAEVAPVEVPSPVTEPADEPAAAPEFEMTEDTMQALAERTAGIVNTKFDELFATMRATNEQAVKDLAATFAALSERVAKLEAPLAETVQQAIADMPRNKTTKLVYRPTQRAQHQAEQPGAEEVTSEEIAQATLANLK